MPLQMLDWRVWYTSLYSAFWSVKWKTRETLPPYLVFLVGQSWDRQFWTLLDPAAYVASMPAGFVLILHPAHYVRDYGEAQSSLIHGGTWLPCLHIGLNV